ncbi:MAG: hypothetical protein JSV91_08415 [Phycisphaerales bacterium]|nr:MAG: hypothetical protein JSV91_08415 [Phycisphaerales bacterium]
MRWLLETIGALWELFLLAAGCRFRLRGRYWSWRKETVFGGDPRRWPPLRDRIGAMIGYGRWVRRMKRGL